MGPRSITELRPPTSWEQFEELCLELYSREFCIFPEMAKNGPSGASQKGVDLWGWSDKPEGLIVVQCKRIRNWPERSLSAKDIARIIEDAAQFDPKIKLLIVATTAAESREITSYLLTRPRFGFEVMVECWSSITNRLFAHPDLIERYLGGWRFDKGQSCFMAPDGNDGSFTGRKPELNHLYAAFSGKAVAASVAITGMPGIGKSALALKFCHAKRGALRNILWVDCSTVTTLNLSVSRCLEALNLARPDTPIDLAESVRRWKIAISESFSDLVVLDNLHNSSILSEHFGASRKCGVLITSNQAEISGISCKYIRLKPLSLPESVIYVVQRTGNGDLKSASRLAEALGGLPLALKQATTFLVRTSCPISKYIDAIAEDSVKALGRPAARIGGSEESVGASLDKTFRLCFDRIKATSPMAAELLSILSFLDAEKIPIALLCDSAVYFDALSAVAHEIQYDPLYILELLEPLSSLSLLQINDDAVTISMPRIFQEFILDSLQDAERNEVGQKLAKVLLQKYSDRLGSEQFVVVRECVELQAHVAKLASLSMQRLAARIEYVELFHKASAYVFLVGRLVEALALQTVALRLGEITLSDSHPLVQRLLNNIGLTLIRLGKLDQARAQLERSLESRTILYGAGHPKTVMPRENLALALMEGKKFAEAELILREIGEIRKEGGGVVDLRESARTANHLATALRKQKKFEESELLLRKCFGDCEGQLGSQNPTTLKTLGNLAQTLVDKGDYLSGLLKQRMVAENLAESLGRQHVDTLRSLVAVASTLVRAGQVEEAVVILKHVFGTRESFFGASEWETAEVGQVLANLLYSLEDFNGSIDVVNRISPPTSGEVASDKLWIRLRHTLARAHLGNGAVEPARETISGLRRLAESLQECDLAFEITYTEAEIFVKRGDLLGATSLLRSELEVRERVGRVDNTYLLAAKCYCVCLAELGYFEDARRGLQRILDLETRFCRASAHKSPGQVDDGYQIFRDARAALAEVLRRQGQDSKAVEQEAIANDMTLEMHRITLNNTCTGLSITARLDMMEI